MITRRTIFEIHRLHDQGFSRRWIAGKLGIDRASVSKYLDNPDQAFQKKGGRKSKLDPYRPLIKRMFEQYPGIKAPVVLQHLEKNGFAGKITIVRDFLKELRGRSHNQEPFIRFESDPGCQMQVDWGHFQSLEYENVRRKLYALAVVEAHSRMLYIHFTHSQKQEHLHMGLLAAFIYFGGTPREIVVDNMMTAVTERSGSLIRFNEAFLDFLRVFRINPRACNIRAPHEKGKVETSIKYLRSNFWPLRNFVNLDDVQDQVRNWLENVANVRVHATTGQRPVDCLQKEALQPLPEKLPDLRETLSPLVHKDFGVRFDNNVYTVPPWVIGKKITLKADDKIVQIYYKDKSISVHQRCWGKKQRIELPAHREQVKKMNKKIIGDRQVIVFLSLGQIAADYLEKLTNARQPIKKNVSHLLALKDEYGSQALIYALEKGLTLKLYGADYIKNILYQFRTPVTKHLPVKLKKKDLNNIRLTTPLLAEYDAIALRRRKK